MARPSLDSRAPFAAVFFLTVARVIWTIRDYGLAWDEPSCIEQGRLVLRWYASRFRDTGLFEKDLYLYGGFFNSLSYMATRLFPQHFLTAIHALNAACALSVVVVTYQLTTTIANRRAGLFAALFLILTPVFYGHMFVNPKDVPFALFYVAALYFFVRALPDIQTPSARSIVAVAVPLGLLLSVRAAGLVLVPVFVLCWAVARPSAGEKVLLKSAGIYFLCTFALAAVIALPWWPYVLLSPFWHLLDLMRKNAHFPYASSVLFRGSYLPAQDLPRSYLPVYFLVSLPEFFLALPLAALALGLKAAGNTVEERRGFFIVLAAFLFPVAGIVIERPTLYDGLRHVLFTLPLLAVLTGAAFDRFLSAPLASAVKSIVAAGVAVSALVTLIDMAQLHPYEMIYFNRIAGGGVAQASERFETDYWGLAHKEAMEWLVANISAAAPVPLINCTRPFQVTYYLDTMPGASKKFRFVDRIDDAEIVLATTRWRADQRFAGEILHTVGRKGAPLMRIIRLRAGKK